MMTIKKIIGRTIAIIVVAIAVIGFGGWILVHTSRVNRFLLAQITQKTESAIGSKIHIGSMSIGWMHLSVDLYDVVISGRSGDVEPPFFSVQHAAAEVYVLPLFKKQFHFAFVTLEHPVVNVLVDKNGNSNMPHPATTNPNSNTITTLLNLQVRNLALRSGEINLRDRRIPLSADLHDLRSQIRFDALRNAYSGLLAYRSGVVSAATISRFQNALQASITLSDSFFDVHPLTIAFGSSRLSAIAHLADFSAPQVEGSYKGDLFAGDFASDLQKPVPVHGELVLSGQLNYRHLAGVPFLNSLTATGEFHSRALTVQYRQIAPEIRLLQANYSLSLGNLHVWNLSAQTLGGTLSANLEMAHVRSHPRSRVNVNLHDVSLSTLDQLAKMQLPEARRLHLLGLANISISAEASSMRSLQARALVNIRNPSHRPAGSAEVPLSGLIDVSYNSARGAAAFRQSWLEVGASRVVLDGSVSRRANLDVRASTTDLHQLTALALGVTREFRQAGTNRGERTTEARLAGLYGSAQFAGTISGRVGDPHIQGSLAAQNLQVRGTSWRSLRTRFTLSSSQATLQNGQLQKDPRGDISFAGQVGLQHWAFTLKSEIQFRSSLQGVSLSEIERAAGKTYPVSGVLTANLSISGSKNSLNGRGQFRLANASLWNQPVKLLNGKAELAGESLALAAQAQTSAGDLSAKLVYSLNTQTYDANVTIPGLNLSQIQQAKLQRLGVSGMLTASAIARGTLQNPSATFSLRITDLQVRSVSFSQVQARLGLEGRKAAFSLVAAEAQAQVNLNGNLALAGQYPIHATLDVPSFSIEPLLASYFPSARQLQGQTAIHATIDGPLKNLSALRAHLSVPTLTMGYQSVHLALVRPLNVDYASGVATVASAELKGTGTDLKIQGRIPLTNSGVPASLTANGSLDLALLQSFNPTAQSSGKIEINIATRGSARSLATNLQGQLRIVNASIFTSRSPVGLENLNATFELANKRINISQFNGQIGGGTLKAQGFVELSKVTAFNLAFQGDRLRIRYPQGICSVLSANLQFSGTTAASQLSGQVLLDELSFTQQFDVATVMTGFTGNSEVSNSSPFMQNLKINVSLQSTRELQLASNQISMAGSANLNIVGTAANPVILGRVGLTGGEVFFMNKRYQVQSGTISFANPARTEPIVNVYVETVVNQYNLTLNFVGPIDRLRTNYTSVPPLSPADIINLVAFGKTTEEAAAAGSTPASVGAESVLAQGVGSQIAGKLQNLTGVSQLTISPNTGSAESSPGARIAVQEQVTGNLLLTFSTDVTASQNTAVQVQYSATKHLSVSVLRDQNGGYALDIRVRKSF